MTEGMQATPESKSTESEKKLGWLARIRSKFNSFTPDHIDFQYKGDDVTLLAINKKTGKTILELNLEEFANATDGQLDDKIVDKIEKAGHTIVPMIQFLTKIF